MPEIVRKSLDADLTLTEGDRCFIARMTAAVVDRDGEVCLPAGMVTTDFESNPAVFMEHDYTKLPLGKVLAIQRTPAANFGKVQCAYRPANHVGEWIPDTVYSLIQQGILKGVSIGFMPIEQRKPTAQDRERFGDSVVRVYSKWNLLELSVAPMPANQEALILAVSKSLLTRAQAKAMGANVPEAAPAVAAPVTKAAKVLQFQTVKRLKFRAIDASDYEVAVNQAVAKRMGKLFV